MRGTRLIINLTFLSTISIQETSCQHDSQLVVKEAVTVRDTGCQVRQRLFPVHPQVGHAEVIHGHLIVFRLPHRFVRRLFGNISVIERLEITVEIHRIVSGRKIGGKLAFRRSIFHDQIHRSSNTITLHIGRQRLGYFQAVQHLGRENVQRYKTVLVVRTRNLYTVNQRIVVTLVHSTQNGILSFAAAVTFHRYTRHSLNNIRHCDVRRKFHGFGTHDVHHIHRLFFDPPGTGLGPSRIAGNHRNAFQQHIVTLQRNFDFRLAAVYHNFVLLVAYIGTDQCIFFSTYRKIERTVQTGYRALGRFFLHDHRCTDNFLPCLRIPDFTFQIPCLCIY